MDFWVLFIVVPILGVLGWVFWLVIGWLAVKKAVQVAGYQEGQMEQLLVQLDSALRTAAAVQNQPGKKTSALPNASSQQQLEIHAMLMKAQNQMAQLDALSRQRYENRVSELSGMAASAGIDWSPGSY